VIPIAYFSTQRQRICTILHPHPFSSRTPHPLTQSHCRFAELTSGQAKLSQYLNLPSLRAKVFRFCGTYEVASTPSTAAHYG